MEAEVRSTLAWLERRGTKRNRDGMARYGIVVGNGKVFGVPMSAMHGLAKRLGRNHALAAALWKTGWYEARTLTAFVDEPGRVTAAQMDRWARAFDNWAICDSLCFHLFDKTPHAWAKLAAWSGRSEEFVRRAAFALLASLSLHDTATADAAFLHGLTLIEAAATDSRNFVKKAVSWALRAVGERNGALHGAALDVARRLAASSDPTSRWVGKDALRQLSSPAVQRRLRAREARLR